MCVDEYLGEWVDARVGGVHAKEPYRLSKEPCRLSKEQYVLIDCRALLTDERDLLADERALLTDYKALLYIFTHLFTMESRDVTEIHRGPTVHYHVESSGNCTTVS